MTSTQERYTASLTDPESLETAPQDVWVSEGQYKQDYFINDPRGVSKYTVELGYVVTQPKHPLPNRALFVLLSPWSEYASRQPQLDRAASIASTTRNSVIAVDMLGQSPNSSKLKGIRRQEVAKGNYQTVATDTWLAAECAAKETGIDLKDKELIIIGPSQGATLAGAMYATKPEWLTVSDVVLWNSPSFTSPFERSDIRLGRTFASKGDIDFKYYAGLNPDWAYRETPKDMLRWAGMLSGILWAPIAGMAGAQTDHVMREALQKQRNINPGITLPRTYIVHAEEDPISPSYSNVNATRQIARAYPYPIGHEVRRIPQHGEYHAITNHLGSVAATAQLVVTAEY